MNTVARMETVWPYPLDSVLKLARTGYVKASRFGVRDHGTGSRYVVVTHIVQSVWGRCTWQRARVRVQRGAELHNTR